MRDTHNHLLKTNRGNADILGCVEKASDLKALTNYQMKMEKSEYRKRVRKEGHSLADGQIRMPKK